MTIIPVMPDGVNKEDYWFLQIEGVEWTYILAEKLTKGLEDVKPEEAVMFMLVVEGIQVYALKKSHVPVEVVVKYTGMTKEVIEKAEVLKLKVKPRPDLPKPTVGYWGTA